MCFKLYTSINKNMNDAKYSHAVSVNIFVNSKHMFVPCKVCGFVIRCHSCNKLGEGGDAGLFISRIPFISAFISPIPIFSSSHVSHQNLKKNIQFYILQYFFFKLTVSGIFFEDIPFTTYFLKIMLQKVSH